MKKIVLFLLIIPLFSWGQLNKIKLGPPDSNRVIKLQEFYTMNQDEFYFDSSQYVFIDTSIEGFYYNNPQLYNFQTNLGNNGSAQKELSLSPTPILSFKTKFDQLDEFRFKESSNKFYNVTQPYAKVSYINGAQNEEGINIQFTQNISEGWNMGVEYKKESSEGFYVRQRNSLNHFRVHQIFKSKNNRYSILANLNYNDNYNEENGGIAYDSLFTDFPENSRKGIDVNYQNAKNTANNQEYYLKQNINFGNKSFIKYVNENDSIYQDSIIGNYITPTLSIYHEFRYNNTLFRFEDSSPDPLNYPSLSLRGQISESTRINELNNIIGIRLRPFHENYIGTFGLDLFGGYDYLEYHQYNVYNGVDLRHDFYTNTIIGGRINNSKSNKYHLKIEASSVISGFDKGDQIISFESHSSIKYFNVSAAISIASTNPELIKREYASFTNTWSNNLNKTNSNNYNLKIEVPKLNFNLSGKFNQTDNYTYFNSNSEVIQYGTTINTFQIELSQKFKVWKLHLDLKGQYQNIDKTGIINLPELITFSSFYLESTLFKKDLLYRIGMDLFWASEYYGDAYDPTIRQYLTQNTTKIESYPWLDVFLIVNIDRTFFFARVSNVLEGAVPYNYFSAPGYPMRDRAFTFGLKWEFIN
ncbi:MAG: putative porin [Salibacteraceae bacterium]